MTRRKTAGAGPFANLTQPGFRAVWNDAKAEIGLSGDTQVAPHILRHTCASRLVRGGVDIRRVQIWLGHRTLSMTMRYAHLVTNDLDASAQAADPVVEAEIEPVEYVRVCDAYGGGSYAYQQRQQRRGPDGGSTGSRRIELPSGIRTLTQATICGSRFSAQDMAVSRAASMRDIGKAETPERGCNTTSNRIANSVRFGRATARKRSIDCGRNTAGRHRGKRLFRLRSHPLAPA